MFYLYRRDNITNTLTVFLITSMCGLIVLGTNLRVASLISHVVCCISRTSSAVRRTSNFKGQLLSGRWHALCIASTRNLLG